MDANPSIQVSILNGEVMIETGVDQGGYDR
jgi:hypothetical protein